MRNKKRIYIILPLMILGYFILNSIRIYKYSFIYFEDKSDVAIVLGAGTNEGILSPIFKERINHSLLLYKKGLVDKIIFTGGFGKGQKESDSQIAKNHAIKNGVPDYNIIIEDKSQFTIENIKESKLIMDSLGVKTALIISDPLHMKRAIKLAGHSGIECKPSPTQTTMYQSIYPKTKLLFYETFFFSLREIISIF
jgi:uncharacterized SAM-binding protein YcdF (DUF218 family)